MVPTGDLTDSEASCSPITEPNTRISILTENQGKIYFPREAKTQKRIIGPPQVLLTIDEHLVTSHASVE